MAAYGNNPFDNDKINPFDIIVPSEKESFVAGIQYDDNLQNFIKKQQTAFDEDKERKKILFLSSFIGTIFNMIVGTLLHFTFNWLNCWSPSGFLMPVNLSVWEHNKIIFWPIIIYAFIEFYFIGNLTHFNWIIISKFLNITIGFGISIITYYTYTQWLTYNLIIDVLTFYVAVNMGQSVGYFILIKPNQPRKVFAINSLFMIIIYAVLFFVFTYQVPDFPIFSDIRTGFSGIHCNM